MTMKIIMIIISLKMAFLVGLSLTLKVQLDSFVNAGHGKQ